jgi:hypothetical protein
VVQARCPALHGTYDQECRQGHVRRSEFVGLWEDCCGTWY